MKDAPVAMQEALIDVINGIHDKHLNEKTPKRKKKVVKKIDYKLEAIKLA